MRDLVGYRRLLACWPGSSSFFDLLSLDKSSSVLLFLIGRLVGTSVCVFARLPYDGNGRVFSSRRRRRASILGCCEESAYDAVVEW